ncbi:MAG: YebC/PmpR family DNA-binding transcriptional regulator [Acetobacteraceae bacterium]|nr:YebC/PmpR family DNA-binding transcriptional regulator [Acetobacteraceae bacterium]
MSGHSKWANIKHRKAQVDAKKGRLYSKLGREIMMAARRGGGNPETNFRLKVAIQKARDASLPSENIMRAIRRGTGELEGEQLEEFTYEGYGPGGAAIYLELLSSNRNRTAADIRHLFAHHGGNLGESGCVAWMFEKRGYLAVEPGPGGMGEEDLMMVALEAGADDLKPEGSGFAVITAPEALERVRQAFEARGVKVARAEITMLPKSTVLVEGRDAERLLELMDALEEHEDVQNVYANFDIPDEVWERYAG